MGGNTADKTKTPPTPEQIKSLLQMAEMQSMGGQAHAKPPYRALLIVLCATVVVMVGAYLLVTWAAHHY
ncbi:MAG TPA: hypothetical protein VGO07_03275 [Candidatus Saccharimonadales bacterium]|jgi:hypothetical protein|nr:hypothetical protein [Candidatus Saccharimonadales bacterium]